MSNVKSIMRLWLYSVFLTATLNAGASDTFCDASEKALFSCLAGKKQVVLCASNDISKSTGYVQYRVKSEGKLEFEYPSTKRPSHDLFFESYILWTADDEQQVFFQNGKYTYLLYDRSFKAGPKDATAGVFVFLKGKPIGGLDCNEPVDPMARAFSASFDKSIFQHKDFPY